MHGKLTTRSGRRQTIHYTLPGLPAGVSMAPQAVTRLGRRLLIVIASCMLAAPIAAQTDTATLESQRAAFKQAYAAASQGGDSWRSLASGLQDYPLYPYLEAASLEHDIQQIDRPTVEAYLKQYPDVIPADDL